MFCYTSVTAGLRCPPERCGNTDSSPPFRNYPSPFTTSFQPVISSYSGPTGVCSVVTAVRCFCYSTNVRRVYLPSKFLSPHMTLCTRFWDLSVGRVGRRCSRTTTGGGRWRGHRYVSVPTGNESSPPRTNDRHRRGECHPLPDFVLVLSWLLPKLFVWRLCVVSCLGETD